MLFISSLIDDSGNVAIYSDGLEINITDYSNYREIEGVAQGGSATEIILSADSSTSDDFYTGGQIEIVDGTGVGQKRMITNYVGSTQTATVATWGVNPSTDSEYVICEGGHLQSNFTDYYKLIITSPDTTVYTMSALGTGDELIAPPSDELAPFTNTFNYENGDGKYTVQLITVPTYDSTATYYISNYPVVYYSGKLYTPIQDTTGNLPIDTDYWIETTEAELSTKYSMTYNVMLVCNTKQCFAEMVSTATDLMSCRMDFCKLPEWRRANEVMMILENIQGVVNSGDWNKASIMIDKAKSICDCCQ